MTLNDTEFDRAIAKDILPSSDEIEKFKQEKANKKLNCNRLDGATIYTTKEPCLMCMGAILSARIKRIVFGARDKRFGTKELAKENNFNHKCEIEEGVLEEECSVILSEFFKELRCKCGSSNQIKYKDK